MAKKQFYMNAGQIAKVMGTVGSPLIVVAELLKNAVDASATEIDIFYNREEKSVAVENNYKGFSIEEIEALSMPGLSSKKTGENYKNIHGMFFTGSKGLGILSVFLLCDETEILTVPADLKIHKIVLDKESGTVEEYVTEQRFERCFTRVILKNVNTEVIDFLSSDTEVRKLRHICTYLYKHGKVPFPKITLHISGQNPQEINFSCVFPPMLYDVCFNYQKEEGKIHFRCNSPEKPINSDEVVFSKFDLVSLQEIMLNHYSIKETISTRTNDLELPYYDAVPSFEGRILVYEKNLAGAQLKTYGAGVNVYVNEFALYNYLAEENDWLGLADYSQRKKVTRLKPHNVFGYVNFPCFDENSEKLQISNERADFIQDLTFSKLMYLLKGVVMFAMLNIDVADKNHKYKDIANESPSNSGQDDSANTEDSSSTSDNDIEQGGNTGSDSEAKSEEGESEENSQKDTGSYSPEIAYKPKQNVKKHLEFTREEGNIINGLKDINDLCNKIYNIVFELSKLDLQVHRYSIACLYRVLVESSTKYLTKQQSKVPFDDKQLETSVINALNYFADISKKGTQPSQKTIKAWRYTVSGRKLFDLLNRYIHTEEPVDADIIQETWNTMKGYIIACLTIS